MFQSENEENLQIFLDFFNVGDYEVDLWTIQNYEAYEKILETEFLTVSDNHILFDDEFKFAYDWIVEKNEEIL